MAHRQTGATEGAESSVFRWAGYRKKLRHTSSTKASLPHSASPHGPAGIMYVQTTTLQHSSLGSKDVPPITAGPLWIIFCQSPLVEVRTRVSVIQTRKDSHPSQLTRISMTEVHFLPEL